MSALVFALSLVLLAAGAFCGYLSLDLLPTSPGLLYAFAGVACAVGAAIVFALGGVAVRVGRLTRAVREQIAAAAAAAAVSALAPVEAEPAPAEAREAEPVEWAEEAAVDSAHQTPPSEPERQAEPAAPEPQADVQDAEELEEPINANRAGHLPTLAEIEQAIQTPEAPPTLVGRYSSGGANYMIFSDGSIEADTDEGAFKFASMGDFKQFLLDRGAGKA